MMRGRKLGETPPSRTTRLTGTEHLTTGHYTRPQHGAIIGGWLIAFRSHGAAVS